MRPGNECPGRRRNAGHFTVATLLGTSHLEHTLAFIDHGDAAPCNSSSDLPVETCARSLAARSSDEREPLLPCEHLGRTILTTSHAVLLSAKSAATKSPMHTRANKLPTHELTNSYSRTR
jgi:hypothetical protein